MNQSKISRRTLLGGLTSVALLQACSSPTKLPGVAVKPQTFPASSDANRIRLFASSGFIADGSRIELAFQRLRNAGFYIDNPDVAYRQFQRFSGSDAQRAADLQDLIHSSTMPKVLLGVRGGYGANRLLPLIDWPSLAAKMREHGTMMFGFSDVCAIQLALLAQGNMPTFAGPMLYSEFGKDPLPNYTFQHFIQGSTQKNLTIDITNTYPQAIDVQGIFWGGNLSVLSSMIGSPYFPDVAGGILFLEDVREQPYRIERMLYTLHLAGVLKKQQAIVLGNFRMDGVNDIYDENYDLYTVIQQIHQVTGVPILTGFPFGHILEKATFPLGAPCRLRSNDNGYSVQFSDYPTLDATALQLNNLFTEDTWDSLLSSNTP